MKPLKTSSNRSPKDVEILLLCPNSCPLPIGSVRAIYNASHFFLSTVDLHIPDRDRLSVILSRGRRPSTPLSVSELTSIHFRSPCRPITGHLSPLM